MENSAPPWFLITAIASLPWIAAFVVGVWKLVSRSTPRASSRQPPAPTPMSRADFVTLQEEVTALSLALGNLQKQLKRMRGYEAVERHRENTRNQPPPVGASKAELREFYGLTGKTPREVAQLALVADRDVQQG